MPKTHNVTIKLMSLDGGLYPGTYTLQTSSLNKLYHWFCKVVPREGFGYRLCMSRDALEAFGGYRSVDGTWYIPLKDKVIGRLRAQVVD